MSGSPLVDAWVKAKLDRRFYRLNGPSGAEFEFRGPQWGHPSNFAAVRLAATPADDLTFDSTASFPGTLAPQYVRKLLSAVEQAIVDELIAGDFHPYRGCRLTLESVGWDDVMSSEVAIYRAARGALMELRAKGDWRLNPDLRSS